MERHIKYQMTNRSDEPYGCGWSSPGEARPTDNTHTEREDSELVEGWLRGRASLAVVRDPGRMHH